MGAGLRFKATRVAGSLVAVVSDLEARRAVVRLADHWRQFGLGEWAVQEKTTGRLLGRVGFTVLPEWVEDSTNIEIGWLLARAAWGKSFATEAGRVSMAFGFQQLGLERVISTALPDNWRSRRVMERLGLSLQGTTTWGGHEFVWYGIDRATWESAARAVKAPSRTR
jgi:RimJ/RimL family protein N-acetyltransferase